MIIKNAKDIKKQRGMLMLYSKPGIGKTSTVRFLKGKTLVLDIDRTSRVLKGCENIDIMEIDNVNTWETWENTIIEISKAYAKGYDNIVIDNISELERCMLSHLGRIGKNSRVPSMANYQQVQFLLVDSIRFLKNLPCNIILTAWEETTPFNDENGQIISVVYPKIMTKIRDNIMGLCDVVARLSIKETDTGEKRRWFRLSPTNFIYAKNQMDTREWCYQEDILGGEGTVEK